MRPFVLLTSKRKSLAFLFCLPELLIKRFHLHFQFFPLALQQQKSRQQTRQRTHQPIQTHLGALMRPFVLLTSKRKSLAFLFCLPELLIKRFPLALQQQKSRQRTRQRTHQSIQTRLGALMHPFVLLTSNQKSLAFIFCLPELLFKRFQLRLKRFPLALQQQKSRQQTRHRTH